jgi:hypothetical protein
MMNVQIRVDFIARETAIPTGIIVAIACLATLLKPILAVIILVSAFPIRMLLTCGDGRKIFGRMGFLPFYPTWFRAEFPATFYVVYLISCAKKLLVALEAGAFSLTDRLLAPLATKSRPASSDLIESSKKSGATCFARSFHPALISRMVCANLVPALPLSVTNKVAKPPFVARLLNIFFAAIFAVVNGH